MFKNYYIGSSITIDKILENSGSVFEHFWGSLPNETDRYYSPFRTDGSPGCRFDYKKGIWYFVDNATYKNKLYFNCIEFVMHMFNINFQEAINKIAEEVEFKSETREFSTFKADIRVIPKPLQKDNYFTRNYRLPINYLKSQNVYSVKRYWTNSRKYNYLKLNSYYNPNAVETFCYTIQDRKELYFPGQEIKYVKNTSSDDYYGTINDDYVILCEGKKDQMILNYHYKLPAIGLQTAHSKIKLDVDKIYILLDPDDAGISGAKRLTKDYPNAINLTKRENEMDIADLFINNKQKLDEILSF